MTSHFDLEDGVFLQQLEDATIEPDIFTHEAHLRLGWILIHKYGLELAETKMCEIIHYLDNTLSDGSKYHKTITIASTQILFHFMQKAAVPDFRTLITTYPDLIYNFKHLLLRHYSPDVLFAHKAKNAFAPPNLIPIIY